MEECILHKTLWIVSGGIEAVPGIKRAKELGLHVVVSDGNPHAPGFYYADDAIVVSTYDIEGTVEKAIQYHKSKRSLDGVLCMAADVPLTVAHVANVINLPGLSIETAKLTSDKIAMKDRFVKKGISVPWYSPLESCDQLQEIIRKQKGQLVIKPVDSRGARGVFKLDKFTPNVQCLYDLSLQSSPSKRLIVEEYLEGLQLSTESILLDEGSYTPGFVDRNYEYLERFAPNIIENGGQQPTQLTPGEKESVIHLAEEAGRAIGITKGTVKGDMILTKGGPKVIEIAPRLSGGWLSTDQIPLATGVDLIGCAIRLALGEKVDPSALVPKFQNGVAIRYFFPKPGKVTGIKNVEKYEKTSWVHKIHFFVGKGDLVEAMTNHTKRAGFVITVGKSREEAVDRAERVINDVKIQTI